LTRRVGFGKVVGVVDPTERIFRDMETKQGDDRRLEERRS